MAEITRQRVVGETAEIGVTMQTPGGPVTITVFHRDWSPRHLEGLYLSWDEALELADALSEVIDEADLGILTDSEEGRE